MAATASAPPPLSPTRAGVTENEDSNISSPLSEVDDKEDDDEDIDHMQLDNDDDERSSVIERQQKGGRRGASESESALSDANSDVNSEANDTEAETERLYDTPQHRRQRDVVVDRYNDGQVFEHTPSKLRRTAIVKDIIDHGDDGSVSGDDASISSSVPVMDESPTKHATTNDTSVDDDHSRDSQERKRKRSPQNDQSDVGQPLRKRTSSLGQRHVEAAANDETVTDAPSPILVEQRGASHSTDEDTDRTHKEQPDIDEENNELETRPTKKITRGSRRKTADIELETQESLRNGNRASATDEIDPHEEHDQDADEEVDPATAHDEELERKHAAFKDWSQIEDMFNVFKDRLYRDRLQRLEEEEQSLLAPVPTHPEFLNMKRCLDDRYEQKISEIDKELEYRLKAHERRAVAQRAQIWSQYFQAVREKREKALEALNKEWYDVQAARRSAHSLQDCGLLFPKDPAQRVRNAIAYSTEVSTLASIAKYEGFPAGPEMKGASSSELEDDLAVIERAKRSRQKPLVQQREDFQAPSFSRLGPAGEQFLKDTPWANPHHSAHKAAHQQTPPQPLDWRPDQAGGRGTQPAPSLPAAEDKTRPGATSANPQSPSLSNRLTESPELTRTLLNPGHTQAERAGSFPSVGRGSKTAAA